MFLLPPFVSNTKCSISGDAGLEGRISFVSRYGSTMELVSATLMLYMLFPVRKGD